MSLGIDLDHPAGVIGRKGSLPNRVYMYKDQPGSYYSASGQIVSENDASLAGFDIEVDKRAAMKQKLLAEAAEKVEKQMREVERQADAEVEKTMAAAAAEREKEVAATKKREAEARKAKAAVPASAAPESPATPAAYSDPVEVVHATSDGEPRETNRRSMEHAGGGKWEVRSKLTDEIIHEGLLSKSEATDMLLERGGA